MKKLLIISLTIFLFSLEPSFCNEVNLIKKVPSIWNISIGDQNFINRGVFLKKIEDELSKTKPNMVGKFYILGPTGIGKTFIAKTYANNKKEEYDIVYLFNSKMDTLEQVKKLNYELSNLNSKNLKKNLIWNSNLNKESSFHYTYEFLRTTQLNWLLIIDDASENSTINEIIPEHTLSKNGHIIYTSQSHNLSINANQTPTPTQKECFDFLTKEIGFKNSKKDELLLLINSLKNYPIALSQSSSYLKKNQSTSVEEYLKILNIEENKNPLSISRKAILTSVYKVKEINKNSIDLLNLISCLHSKKIPVSLLKNWFENNSKSTINEFFEIISLATSYSLITPSKDDNNFLETHDFIQETIYNTLSKKEVDHLNNSLIKSIRSEFMKENKDIVNPSFSEIIDHAKTAFTRGSKSNDFSDDFLSLLIDILEHNNTYKRDFYSSYSYISQISPLFESKSIKNRKIKSRFFLTSSRFFWRLGMMNECDKYLKLAKKEIDFYDTENYSRFKIYQSDFEIEKGNKILAKKHLDDLGKYVSKYGYSKNKESSTYFYLLSLHHMSLTDYFNLSCDFENALKNINFVIENVDNYYLKKTKKPSPLSIMAPIYNAKNFSVTMINNNSIPLIEIKKYTNDLEKSLNSKEHRFVNFSRIILGRNLTKTNPIDGIDELKTAIINLEKWFKGSSVNKEQAFAHSSIGLIYLEINEIDKAIEHFKKSLSISKNIFTNLSNSYVNEAFSGIVLCYLKKDMVYEAQKAYNSHKKIFTDNEKSSKILFKKIIEHYNQMEKT